MNFLTRIVYKGSIPKPFDVVKIRKVVNKRGRAVIFWCRVTGAYYLNTHRVYELPACEKSFRDIGRMPEIQIDINFTHEGGDKK